MYLENICIQWDWPARLMKKPFKHLMIKYTSKVRTFRGGNKKRIIQKDLLFFFSNDLKNTLLSNKYGEIFEGSVFETILKQTLLIFLYFKCIFEKKGGPSIFLKSAKGDLVCLSLGRRQTYLSFFWECMLMSEYKIICRYIYLEL